MEMITSKMHKNADRADTFDKCSGRACYIHDMQVDGCLCAFTVALPVGVEKSLQYIFRFFLRDILMWIITIFPVRIRLVFLEITVPILPKMRSIILGNRFYYSLDQIREKLAQLAGEIEIEYNEIPAILTLDEALSSSKPPLHKENNVYVDECFGRGDVDT